MFRSRPLTPGWLLALATPLLLLFGGCSGTEEPPGDDDTGDPTSPPDSPPDEPGPPDVAIYPTAVNFGTVPVGVTSKAYMVVQNRGEGVLELSVSLSSDNGNDYRLSPDFELPPTLEADAAATIGIEFSPTTDGEAAGTLTITSNDPAEPTVTVDLIGTGEGTPDEDRDGDGFTIADGDCDDDDETVNPDAGEVCDQRDNDCDDEVDEEGQTTFYIDADGDGFGNPDQSQTTCAASAPFVTNGDDCDDLDPSIYPEAPELCDDQDNDCDDVIDEEIQSTFYRDADGDGHGDPAQVIDTCLPSNGEVASADDCDDADPNRYPGNDELCDGLDNDCDQEVDEGLATNTLYRDADGDGYGDADAPVEACGPGSGLSASSSDCDDDDDAVYPEAPEACDQQDNDCDGQIDEDGSSTWYDDADGDGYGDPATAEVKCSHTSSEVDRAGDCNDQDRAVNPAGSEVCNGRDDDCDGAMDDDDSAVTGAPVWYTDQDGDGYGAASSPRTACLQPDGTVDNKLDCDDQDAARTPETVWYLDFDQDGHGTSAVTLTQCNQPQGFTLSSGDCDDTDDRFYPGAAEDDCGDPNDYNCDGSTAFEDGDGDGFAACNDCDDTDEAVNPTATEACDGRDNDCDGKTDDADSPVQGQSTWYRDADGDSYGASASSTRACAQPSGYVSNASDCNDADQAINPTTKWYLDVDKDGYGDSSRVTTSCTAPSQDHVTRGGDCDDRSSSYNPGAAEGCDGKDYNCDGKIDHDADSDGYAAASCGGNDCDDTNAAVKPEAGKGCALGKHCKEIKERGYSTGNGVYTIDPDGFGTGVEPFDVYCNMNTDGGGWTLLLNLASRDSAIHEYYDTAFWQGEGTEGAAATARTTGHKSKAFSSLKEFTDVMIELHDAGTAIGYAIYQTESAYRTRSLSYLMNNVSNAPITGKRLKGQGSPGTTKNPNRGQRLNGDLFLDFDDPLVVNSVAKWSAQINYNRLATTLSNSDYGHTYAGLGGYHVHSGWSIYYESAPISPYCSITNGYGEEATYTRGNYKSQSGYSFPYQASCRGTAEGSVFVWLSIDTAIWVR